MPEPEFRADGPGARPASHAAAVARNRDVLRRLTQNWVAAFPASSHAAEALALMLETTGELIAASRADTTALDALRQARRLASDGNQLLRLGVAEVRLLFKAGQYAEAAHTADSLLAANPGPTPLQAAHLAGVAALAGRVHRTAQLLATSAPEHEPQTADGVRVQPPLVVKEAALSLLGYATFGSEPESSRVLLRRVAVEVHRWVPRDQVAIVEQALLRYPAAFLFPQIGLSSVHRPKGGGPLLEMQWALVRGDTGSMRAWPARIVARSRQSGVVTIAPEFAFPASLLLLAVRDSTAAAELLDLVLGSLPTTHVRLLEHAPAPAMVVRAMALRAELAARSSDTATARRWGGAVAKLWAGADPSLHPIVSRARRLAGGTVVR